MNKVGTLVEQLDTSGHSEARVRNATCNILQQPGNSAAPGETQSVIKDPEVVNDPAVVLQGKNNMLFACIGGQSLVGYLLPVGCRFLSSKTTSPFLRSPSRFVCIFPPFS